MRIALGLAIALASTLAACATRSAPCARAACARRIGPAATVEATPEPAPRATTDAPGTHPPPATGVPATGDEIVICGRRVHTGAPVVLWTEGPRYDAYATRPRFAPASDDPRAGERRYQPGRVEKRAAEVSGLVSGAAVGAPGTASSPASAASDAPRVLVAPDEGDPRRLAEVVDQFVLHYDVAGLSRACFAVLHDERRLSVHFLLDLDGTIYQTLDLRETAWHATKANGRSIGVEIANVGARPPEAAARLEAAYGRDAAGPFVRVPATPAESGLRDPGPVPRPARDGLVRGRVQGEDLVQYDFTPRQYDSLVRLAAALCRAFPRLPPDAPRDASGRVRDAALSDAEWATFRGILGHYHVQTNKVDPGPAFDWERFLAEVRARLAETPPP